MLALRAPEHPTLELGCFATRFPSELGALVVAESVRALFTPAPTGLAGVAPPDDAVRKAVRDLLRHGGYKPTGRGKPSSEYLLAAVAEQALGSINLAVDACNAVSYQSGLPISVVDLDRAAEPLSVAIAEAGTTYVFNASGQVIDVGGLLCLFDGSGPCANAVKDAQRTKTQAGTVRTLSVVWGTRALPGRTAATVRAYRALLEGAGATTEDVHVALAAG